MLHTSTSCIIKNVPCSKMAEVLKFELILLAILLRILYANSHPVASGEQPFSTSSPPTRCQFALEPFAAYNGRSLHLPDISRRQSRCRTRSTLLANKLKVSQKSVLSLATICLLLSGDVELNPGPRYKFPCGWCEKPVRANQKGLQCDECDKWFHSVCEQVPPGTLAGGDDDWFCSLCSLPFLSDSFLILQLPLTMPPTPRWSQVWMWT